MKVFFKFDVERYKAERNLDELITDVIFVHKKLFPLASFESQCSHFEEEVKETKKALTEHKPTEVSKEIADVFITICGIIRFRPIIGQSMLFGFLQTVEDFNLFFEETCKKMEENQARTWEYLGNGDYHHVSDNKEDTVRE